MWWVCCHTEQRLLQSGARCRMILFVSSVFPCAKRIHPVRVGRFLKAEVMGWNRGLLAHHLADSGLLLFGTYPWPTSLWLGGLIGSG